LSSLKIKGKKNSQTFRAASLVVQRSIDNWFGAEKGRVSSANSKVSSAKIINHGADKDRRCWQARIGFTMHAASFALILRWERKRLCQRGRGRIGMSSRICETNGWLPNSKRTREVERR